MAGKPSRMLVMALTGGIATGKSTVVQMLRECFQGSVCYDCDRRVGHMMRHSAVVRLELVQAFGPGVIAADGCVDRSFLRERVFSDQAQKSKLEAILHPKLRQECLALCEESRRKGVQWFLADVPLLFETGFDIGQNVVITVATSHKTQIHRLRARSGFDDSMIDAILAAQLPLAEKIARADVVFWNEGPLEVLREQVKRFAKEVNMTIRTETHSENTEVACDTPAIAESAVRPTIDINELRQKPLSELLDLAAAVPGRIQPGIPKALLVQELLWFFGQDGVCLECVGVLEGAKDNFCMLRDPARSFRPSPDDIHMNTQLMRDHGLRIGQKIRVRVKPPRERGKYMTVAEVLAVEGIPLAEYHEPKDFEKLTPLFPNERLMLEGEGPEFLGVRVIDLIAPLGKGQRGLIVAPPRGGKTILLKQIAKAIRNNHPKAELVVLLLDERPEEVTDFEETVGCTVFASTFDESVRRHAQVAELVIERAKRLVEMGKDVVLLLDSLTRLARGYNSGMQAGPIGSGGVSPVALQKARKFFGTARNVEEGGSLTILATALVETESRLDDVVFEEFKGTGNMEVRLDRELAERRVFPAIHIPQSGTRNDDRLYHPDEFVKVVDIRRQLAQLPIGDAIQTLLANLKATKSNTELLLRGMR